MPQLYFDCTVDGVTKTDKYGMDMPGDEVVDQADGLVRDMLVEVLDERRPRSASVTVRDTEGGVVCVAQGEVGCSMSGMQR